MRFLVFAPLLLLSSCSSCDSDLVPACLGGARCWIDDAGVPRTDGIENVELRGVCNTGTIECPSGRCAGFVAPGVEVCDGEDNDCDAVTDELPSENSGDTCANPACGTVVLACVGGAWRCSYDCTPGPEICNGYDDDLNGIADDDIPAEFFYPEADYPNTVGVGGCRPGIRRCIDGRIVETPPVTPGAEYACPPNGIDEDCDGKTDETDDPPSPVSIVLVIDISGSMDSLFLPVSQTINQIASDPAFADHRFAIVAVAKGQTAPHVAVMQDFDTAAETHATLTDPAFYSDSSSAEFMVEGSIVGGSLEWPPDALHAVIGFTDEPVQFYDRTFEDLVDACTVEPFVLSMFVASPHVLDWVSTTTTCGGFVDLLDSDPAAMAQTIRDRFTGGC